MPPTPVQLPFRAYRGVLLSYLGVITLIGLGAKFYPGPGRRWLNDTFGGTPYEIFWILLIAIIFPRAKAIYIAIGVLIATCSLEFLQLWQPAWLQTIRGTLLGRLILGNTFSWSDFPYYFIGCALGWLWLQWLERYQHA
jgi:hypothetical protein